MNRCSEWIWADGPYQGILAKRSKLSQARQSRQAKKAWTEEADCADFAESSDQVLRGKTPMDGRSMCLRPARRGLDFMSDTKLLLQRIAALRDRLSADAKSAHATPDPLRAVADMVERGSAQHEMIESALKMAEPSAPATETASMRLTGRGARLLRKGRELLHALRQIADDAEYQALAPEDVLTEIHHEATAMLELLLRTAQGFSPTVSVQLRMCDGLEVVLAEIEERIATLSSLLTQRKQTTARINGLADYLRALVVKQPVSLAPLQAMAEAILADAKAEAPLRFLHASPAEPARFTAAHSLNVAHVVARVLHGDPEWRPQAQLAVMAALVHDIGMLRVPAEILLSERPLEGDQRRLIEKHTIIAEEILEQLWPGGGWPTEAARDHHERNDGTGYPLGRHDLQLSAYVKLLAVCDVYAALCAPRPHRPAFDTRTALTETLMLAERGFLDGPSAERLLTLSFYPVGSAVELNDGAIGLVIATHPGSRGLTNPARPIVHIAADAQGKPPEWPMVVDLLETTDRRILRGLNADEKRTMLGKRLPQAI
jgi:HD-GYP domain-containing protein (c-di-GMP phosphodiesterase class II)